MRFTAIIATFMEHLRDLDWLIAHKKHIHLLGASYMIKSTWLSEILTSISGTKGPFPAAAAMVVMFIYFLWQVGKRNESSVCGMLKI